MPRWNVAARASGERRWWRPLILGGAALWIGVSILIASRSEPDSAAARITLAAGGFVYFTTVIVLSAWASGPRESVAPLLRALVVSGDAEAVGRRIDADTRKTGLVYRVGAVVLVALLFGFLAIGETSLLPYYLGAAGLVVAVLIGYLVLVARKQVKAGASSFAGLLGLELRSTPTYVRTPGLAGGFDGGGMIGAVEYAGVRHGRPVVIVQTAAEAVTSVGLTAELPVLARTADPAWFASVTGLGPAAWAGVSATRHGPGQVIVVREATGAGSFMLHDLLLAERLAAAG